MPFRPDLALRFADELLRYLQFQSTIEVLKGEIDPLSLLPYHS